MAKTEEKLEATVGLERAQHALGEALKHTQDLAKRDPVIGADAVCQSLAESIKGLFQLRTKGFVAKESPSLVANTMDRLRQTLEILQDVRSDDIVLERSSRTVARSLAILYPISRLVEELDDEGGPDSLSTSSTGDKGTSLRERKSRDAQPVATERRASPRHLLEVDIGIYSDTNFFAGFTEDISSGGIFISTFDTLPIGSQVNVNFRLPDGPLVSLDGSVRWVREYNETAPDVDPGMGIRFEGMHSEVAEQINHYMAEHPPLFYE
jgi:uncharacterized protein (TIGR02266 family)